MNWTHLWFCVVTFHDGHTGCGDLVWVSDAYDMATGIVSLAAMSVVPLWMFADWCRGIR